ncbi:MAG: segregation/condensation protein A [Veillonellaceae bacterium]|nr:segregation/condensation protein A [Veillonellaceae bacterium]
MENYQIHLQSFEGPMDLLMHLIAKNKIDIYDIPIATLTEQYLAYLDEMKRFDIEIASSFLVMAATLLSIKSRMMLPKTVVTEDEEEEDPRRELVERILAYRKYQQASLELTARAEQEGRFCSRPPMKLPAHRVLAGPLSLKKLLEAYGMAVRVGEELAIPEALVTPDPIRVQDRIEEIEHLLERTQRPLRFSETFRMGDLGSLITSFLAVLELLRLGRVHAWQTADGREFMIQSRKEGTPHDA